MESSSLEVTFDARFDASISFESITTVMQSVTISGSTQTYAEVMVATEMVTLVQFSQLISVSFETVVTSESYVELSEIAFESWSVVDESK